MAAAIRSKLPSYRCWLSTSLHRLHVRLASSLVVAEHDGGKLKDSTLSAIAAAGGLEESSTISVLLGGTGPAFKEAASSKAHPSITNVLMADLKKLEHDSAEPWAEVIVKAARTDKYSHVVTASTSFGKNKKNFTMLEKLADKLGGAVGASRAAMPNVMQISQTGKSRVIPHTILRASFATKSHGKEPKCIDEATDSERLKDCLNSLKVLKGQMDRIKHRLDHMKVLYSEWVARDMIVCAGEIWMWVVKKKGCVGGNGRHLFDPSVQGLVQRAAIGMTMTHDIDAMKEMSQLCIVARNDAVPLNTVEELENLVRLCEKGMSMFPHLEVSHPNQWYTINKYWSLKAVLHESFKK